jgi:hypothetical protein
MRLWSIHPSYLDRQGLLAVWREGLLAQKVLQGKTKGYKNHSQLKRFRDKDIRYLKTYLYNIAQEMFTRKYNPNIIKINLHLRDYLEIMKEEKITVTKGQLDYEFIHLQNKLKKRNLQKYSDNKTNFRENGGIIKPHPLFKVVEGGIESWEKIL